MMFEELRFLTIEGNRKTGEVQANVGTFGHFYLVLNMLAESVSSEYPEDIEGSAKYI